MEGKKITWNRKWVAGSIVALAILFFALGASLYLGWRPFGLVKGLLGITPVKQETKTDLQTLTSLGESVLDTHGQVRTYLLLFQNDLELRPGGGFIGSFGILKIQDGRLVSLEIHDTGNFDGRIPDTVPAPYPMAETLHVTSWKMRDSNYFPDFRDNADQAKYFYALGNGQEQFDGVVGITSGVLESILTITGPVSVDGFPGTYDAKSGVLDLEYQVEQGYRTQGIDFGERKSFMSPLADAILQKVKTMTLTEKYALFKVLLEDLHSKDIQLSFTDAELQATVKKAGWDGAFDEDWSNDFLFPVDANLNSFKSDYYIKRHYAYTLDLTGDVPKGTLAVTYEHTAQKADYLVKDYQTYLRLYVPKGSFLESVDGVTHETQYGDYRGKKYFGDIVQVPLGTTKTVTFTYTIPKDSLASPYRLKIQHQAGTGASTYTLTLKDNAGTHTQTLDIAKDTEVSF